jgi:hypothetical protein
MKIKYRRTGGIANLKIEFEFDSDTLSGERLALLKDLLKSKSMAKPLHPDDFIHELEVLEGLKRTKLRFAESRLSAEEIKLFESLEHHPRK